MKKLLKGLAVAAVALALTAFGPVGGGGGGNGGGGGLFGSTVIVPSLSSFTWLNQGSSTSPTGAYGFSLVFGNEGSNNIARGVYKLAPSAPYTATALVTLPANFADNPALLVGWYDGSSKLDTLATYSQPGNPWVFYEYQFSAPSTYVGRTGETGTVIGPYEWLQLADSGTAVTVSVSFDGVNFAQVWTQTKSSGYLGSAGYSNIFIGCNCYNGPLAFAVMSYTD